MPFRKRCRITMENIADAADDALLPDRLRARPTCRKTRRTSTPSSGATNPLPYKEVYTILDGVEGEGQYVGTYMAWGVNNTGWWGEGEIKFFMDGDNEFPTICGTGTEDYFCGSYNFENRGPTQAVPGIHHALCRPAASDPARRPVPVADSASGCIAGTSPIPIRFEQDLR